jgi:hypothetical protein
MKKSLLFVGLLTFSSMMFAAAKSYTLTITAPTKVGSAQLAKGNYTMRVEGDKAIFTDEKSKKVSVPVKLETGTGKKFEFTSTESSGDAIKLIHLAGSTTTVEFGD